ncbi:serine/threonine-protein phosphatase 5-like [Panonychus citri]|uniref:serine/threonine-protein phosphatase 5-like n=1 Tax=Panonychus citri TaxID=50023 RepID=UPI0023078F35|nr:serine/threonine-protein phosphatase 5-like [Panonychus citri]XP_053209208.1 serine/threonine-protein phosphatase 5-like [Panonychus citri]XP_053209209.1 serine/threonine-protein phosphatase 5-like [Panonychus citri]
MSSATFACSSPAETPPSETLASQDNGNDGRIAMACTLKETANQHFKDQDYLQAILLYSQAISYDDTSATLYSNRSIAHLRLENFGYALSDATKAIECDPNYVKGYYRRAAAHMALGKYRESLKDFEHILRINPSNKEARLRLNECKRLIRKQAFEKAISVDCEKSIASTIDPDSMECESNYDGPHLVNGQVTLEFVQALIETFKQGKKLDKKYAYMIILQVADLFRKCNSLVDVTIPQTEYSKFTVCGDIHGQYFDLLNIFRLNELPSETNPYLFNGDFVDRGSFSVECILTLFAFKALYPDHFFMSRGNHESQTMNQMYGFEGEVKSKYSSTMYDLFTETFNLLPLAHCLNKRVLVMHGGLFSSDTVTLDDIRKVDRFRQPPDEGIMCELLWSDPMNKHGRAPSKRGVGIQFGPDVTHNFCKFNNLDYIIRSHEVKHQGYEVAHHGKMITVFSAPNYCDAIGNQGAFINMNGKYMIPDYITYSEVPHPDVKPMAYASSFFGLRS